MVKNEKISSWSASAAKGFVFISLFSRVLLLPKTCLAFQAITVGARIANNSPSITCQSIKKDDAQESTPSETTGESSPTSPHDNIMTAEDVVINCMDALQKNDSPWENNGLEVCFDFSSDRCRASMGGDLEEFILKSKNPTFGSMTNADEYTVLNVGSMIAAGKTRGAMQTVLIKVKPAKGGEDRAFLW